MACKYLRIISLTLLIGLYVAAWWFMHPSRERDLFLCSAGQIETINHDMVTSKPGVIRQVDAHLGDTVTIGQLVAYINTQDLETQLHETEVSLQKAQIAAEKAKNQLNLYMRSRQFVLQQFSKNSKHVDISNISNKYYSDLFSYDRIYKQVLRNDNDAEMEREQRQRDISNAKKEKAEWNAKVTAVRSQLIDAQSAVVAAETTIMQLQTDIDAGALATPVTGKILRQYVRDGDRVGQGDKVLQVMDLQDVSIKFSLPRYHAATLAIGTEIRMVLDSPSSRVLPAQIAHIATIAPSFFSIWDELVDHKYQQVVVKAKIPCEFIKTCYCDLIGNEKGIVYIKAARDSMWPLRLSVRFNDCDSQNYQCKSDKISKITIINSVE